MLKAEAKAEFVSGNADLMIKIESSGNLTVKAEHTPILADRRFDQTAFEVWKENELLGESFG